MSSPHPGGKYEKRVNTASGIFKSGNDGRAGDYFCRDCPGSGHRVESV